MTYTNRFCIGILAVFVLIVLVEAALTVLVLVLVLVEAALTVLSAVSKIKLKVYYVFL
jgi:hypothetical protein